MVIIQQIYERLYLIHAAVENKELACKGSGGKLAAGASKLGERSIMAATGELIRLINYVDDINTTMRRIQASLYGMEAEERKRLAESLRGAEDRLHELLQQVEK